MPPPKGTRAWLVREIAKDLRMRPEVVDLVLKRFQDIAVECLVNDDKFVLDGLFSVSSSEHEGRLSPSGEPLPRQKRLSVRLSENIRKLYRLQHDVFLDKEGIVNRDSWRDALKWKKKTQKNRPVETLPQVPVSPVATEEYNPLLDDEE